MKIYNTVSYAYFHGFAFKNSGVIQIFFNPKLKNKNSYSCFMERSGP